MKRIFFVFITFFLIVGSKHLLFASQNDFYGTWISNTVDDDGLSVFKFVISSSSITTEMEIIPDSGEPFSHKGTLEIISWLESVNVNNNTKNDYPNGYILRVRNEDGHISSFIFYISRNNRQFIMSLSTNDRGFMIFIKQ